MGRRGCDWRRGKKVEGVANSFLMNSADNENIALLFCSIVHKLAVFVAADSASE